MSRNNKITKWNEAYKSADIESASQASVLKDHDFLLPKDGDALDLACGRGGNALFLATLPDHNFRVDAVDYSNNVIDALNAYVNAHKLPINPVLRDIEKEGLPQKEYDLIVVSYFLYRPLFSQIINALKPDGLLYYQTWSQEKIDNSGPANPNFRLKKGELLSLCREITPLFYQEYGDTGDVHQGLRNEALIIAKK